MDKRNKKTVEEVKTETIQEVSFAEFERTMKKIVKSKPENKLSNKK